MKFIMTKNQQLDLLFDEWRQYNPEYQDNFIKDGIVDEELFDKQSVKLLFIAKEANTTDKNLDFRELWKMPVKFKFGFSIAELAYGIQNGFPDFDLIKGKKDLYQSALRNISFLDVKKTSGTGKSDNEKIKENIAKNKQFLHKQIDIINPDVIVSGLFERRLIDELFDRPKFCLTGHGRCVFKWKNIKVIDFYHPSGQSAPVAMYYLMEKIFRSDIFATL